MRRFGPSRLLLRQPPKVFLKALALSATGLVLGNASSGAILGATPGSTITASGLPSGFTINGPARTWSWSGTGSAASTTITLTETFPLASNSPRATNLGITVTAAEEDLTPPTLTKTSTDPNRLAFDITFGDNTNGGAYVGLQLATDNTFTPTSPSAIVITGDSYTGSYSGYYAGHYAVAHPTLDVQYQGIGGTGITGMAGLIAREAQVIMSRPRIVHIGTGRNDLANTGAFSTADDWYNAYIGSIARLKAAMPWVKVSVETITPQTVGDSSYQSLLESRRAYVNAKLRTEPLIDAVVDFAGDSTLNNPANWVAAAASSSTITTDGLHFYTDDNFTHTTGHARAWNIFYPVMDALVAATPIVPGTLLGEELEFINSEVLDEGPVFNILAQQPDGNIFARAWIETDEPQRSAYSNVISAAVLAPPIPAKWSSTNKTTLGTLSTDGLVWDYNNSSPGSPACIAANKSRQYGKSEIGFVLDFHGATVFDPTIQLGVCLATENMATYVVPGMYNSHGLCFNIYPAENDVYQNTGTYITTYGNVATGADCRLLIDHDAKKVWMKINGVVQGGGDPTAGTGGIDVSSWMSGPVTVFSCLNAVRTITLVPDPSGRTSGFGTLG